MQAKGQTVAELACERDGVPTRLACAGCGAGICPKCLARTAVGFKSPSCVGAGAGPAASGRRRRGLAVAGAAVVVLAGAAFLVRPSGGSPPVPGPAAPTGALAPGTQAMIGDEVRDGQVTFVVDDLTCGSTPLQVVGATRSTSTPTSACPWSSSSTCPTPSIRSRPSSGERDRAASACGSASSGGRAEDGRTLRRRITPDPFEFVDDGMTDEPGRRGPYAGDRYPGRWAPILVVWTSQSGGRPEIEVVGSGYPARVGMCWCRGRSPSTSKRSGTGPVGHRCREGSGPATLPASAPSGPGA